MIATGGERGERRQLILSRLPVATKHVTNGLFDVETLFQRQMINSASSQIVYCFFSVVDIFGSPFLCNFVIIIIYARTTRKMF